MTREQFLAEAWAAAEKSSASSGLPAAVTVAQAALESNWGRSGLSREANNYFGLKAHGEHAWVEMQTTECDAGGEHVVTARFARYGSMEECFADRDAVILRAAVYAEARACKDDEAGFVRALAKHWATDPKYAEKVLAVRGEIREQGPGNREQKNLSHG